MRWQLCSSAGGRQIRPTQNSLVNSNSRGLPSTQPFINIQVVLSHALGSEMLLEMLPAISSVDLANPFHRIYGRINIGHDETRSPIRDDLRNRSERMRDDGGSTGQRLDHYQPKRLRPINGKQQRGSISQESIFLRGSDFANELDKRMIEQRLNDSLEVVPVGTIDLGGNF